MKLARNLELPPDEAITQKFLVLGRTGSGKRLSLDTPLATPTGWTPMRDIRVGDRLFDENGQPCAVTYVGDVNFGDSYRITFSDGSQIEADAEHLWLTWDRAARRAEQTRVPQPDPSRSVRPQCRVQSVPTVRTTTEVAETLYVGAYRNHSVANASPLRLAHRRLPIHPYVLGAWLGDGVQGTGRIIAGDGGEGVLSEIVAAGHGVRPCNQPITYLVQGLYPLLRQQRLLRDKHVPTRYLRAAVSQRLSLLQGLMDTDGGTEGGQAVFTNKNPRLAAAVYELVVSLGMKATRKTRRAKLYGKDCGEKHVVCFTPTMGVFRLAYKSQGIRFDVSQQSRRRHRYIVDVTAIPSIPMRCIAVDSPSRLYLAGDSMIPTHNTNTCAAMAEELLEMRCPFIAFDPLGNWWGLKSKYQVIQFGGEKGDLPLEPTAGKVVADFAVAERQPLILSLKEFGENEMARFATDFSKELYRRNKHPVHVFVDEADLFAPQTGASSVRAVCLGAMQNLMRRGRACGIGMTAVTQRSASLHTDLRTQAEVLIAHQTTGPHDVEAIRKWIQYHVGDEMADVLKQIAKLQPGEAWVFSPGWLDSLAKYKIRKRKSFDSAATPKLGERRKIPSFKKIKLEALKDEMTRVVEQAKANDPELLKKKVWELEQQLSAAKRVNDKAAEGDPDQVRTLKAQLDTVNNAYRELWQQNRQALLRSQEHLDTLDAIRDMTLHGAVISIPPEEPELQLPEVHAVREEPVRTSPIKDMLTQEDAKFLAAVNGSGGNSDLSNMQRKFLTALAQHPQGLTKKQLLILTGYASSGPVSKCFGQMNRDGWVETVEAGKLSITTEGLAVLGRYTPLPRGAELRQLRLADPNLKPVDKAILEVLFTVYPNDIAKGEILKQAGYASSGPTSKSFGKLCRLGWAVKTSQGRLKASELFYE